MSYNPNGSIINGKQIPRNSSFHNPYSLYGQLPPSQVPQYPEYMDHFGYSSSPYTHGEYHYYPVNNNVHMSGGYTYLPPIASAHYYGNNPQSVYDSNRSTYEPHLHSSKDEPMLYHNHYHHHDHHSSAQGHPSTARHESLPPIEQHVFIVVFPS